MNHQCLPGFLRLDLRFDRANVGPALQSLSLLIAVIATTIPAAPLVAGESRLVEEIIVTAERREQNILEVPVTMSAFSSKLIEELGMTNAQDLEQMVPGLQFGSAALQQRNDGQSITIRGIGTQSAREEHRDLAVATYVDGVYTVDTYGLAPNMFDLERVEVARGPQGTLHGRNSIAGAIYLYTKRPTKTWDVDMLAEFTDVTTQRYNLAFGGPLLGDLAFRVTGGYFEGDGLQKNAGLGNDLGAPDQWSLSPQLRYQNKHFDLNFKYQRVEDKGAETELVRFTEYARDNYAQNQNWYLYDEPVPSLTDCSDPVVFGAFPGNPFIPSPDTAVQNLYCDGDLKNRILSNEDGTQDSHTDRYNFSADWNLSEGLTLSYVYGHTKTETTTSQDGDQTSRVGTANDPTIPTDLDNNQIINCGFLGTMIGELDCWTQGQSDFGLAFQDTQELYNFSNEESSHELHLVSNFEGKLNFLMGIYYYENETFWEQATLDFANPLRFVDADEAAVAASPIFGVFPVTSCQSYLDDFFLPTFGDPATGTAFGLGIGCPEGMDHTKSVSFFSGTEDETFAVFADVDYELTERWTLSFGLRWTEDKKQQSNRVPADLEPAAGTVGEGDVPNGLFVGDFFGTGVPVAFTSGTESPTSDKWSHLIGHASVEYTPQENRLYYARISTGYRAGGFNVFNLDLGNSFDEETLTNYEIGMKGLFLDGKLQLTSGIFYQDYDGYQLTATQLLDPEFIQPTDSSPLRSYTANAADGTEIWGLELEAFYQITDRWRISGYYNYLGSKLGSHATVVRADPDQEFTDYTYTNFVLGQPPDFQVTTQVPIPRDHKGDELPQMPNHKGAVTLSYELPSDIGNWFFLTTWSYTGERWPQGGGNVPRTEIPSYDRWDIRANWTSPNAVWTVGAFVQNVLNDIGISEAIAIDGRGALTEPRSAGVHVRWRPNL